MVARASSAAWYEGIGSTHADAADFEGEPTIPPKLIEELRDELAAGDPKAPFSRRRLEFPAAPPGGDGLRRGLGRGGGARSARRAGGRRRHPAARARAHARRVVPAGPPPRSPSSRRSDGSRDPDLGAAGRARGVRRRSCAQRLEHLVPVTEPLVLCSQIQRSGGTLLSQLFDGHPECHAHPHEIKIGWPREANWPPLDLDRPGDWFERLFEKKALTHFVEGYQKRGAKLEAKTYPSYDVFPFLFLPRLQKAIFDARAAGAADDRARRARRLLHFVLQRLARQPEPLHRAEEGRHRLHPAAGDGRGEPRASSSPRTPTARWSRSSASRRRGTGRRQRTRASTTPTRRRRSDCGASRPRPRSTTASRPRHVRASGLEHGRR